MKESLHNSVEAKVGQLLFVGFQGTALSAETREIVERLQPGGFLLFGRNLETLDQTCELNATLWHLSRRVPFLAIDQEGGLVDRLKQLFAPIPSFPAAASHGIRAVRGLARVVASEMEAAGFNTDFAPVADLDLDGAAVRHRASASDPLDVGRYCYAFLDELKRRGLCGCLKHFPGLGAAAVDPHFRLPRVTRNRQTLFEADLIPYLMALSEAAFVMVAHAHYPEIDEHTVPASLSSRVIEKILRKKLGFDGIAITDDLTMGAVTALGLKPETFLEAIAAGNDMVLFTQVTPLLSAGAELLIREARRSPAFARRVDEAYTRVLSRKAQLSRNPPVHRPQNRARVLRQIERLWQVATPAESVSVASV